MRGRMLLTFAMALGACGGQIGDDASSEASLTANQALGREVWLKATFGGQAMFSLILPFPPANLPMAFDQVLTTPRAQRFAKWGVINDPGCHDGSAATHGLDVCDPETNVLPASLVGEPTGVVGVRKFPNPLLGHPEIAIAKGLNPGAASVPFLVGVSCAGCHAGWDPAHPPASTAAPTWANIHVTAGNQYVLTGKIFGNKLDPSDPRWQVFHSWKAGTVDTTAIESDHINNPGIITQFWNVPSRPFFDLHYSSFGVIDPPSAGPGIHVHRGGQGGEDDTGCQMAALRVYFNIGMCAAECMFPHLSNSSTVPGGQTPIDLADCSTKCSAYSSAAQLVNPMCDFMATTSSPVLPASYVNAALAAKGQKVFDRACASCHAHSSLPSGDILSDDQLHKAGGLTANELFGEIGTNSCRSKTTNWQAGQIWAAFSSDEQKARGPGNYRDVPIVGAWATAPFFHNNELGAQPNLDDPNTITIEGRLALFEDAMDQLLNPWKRSPAVNTTTQAITVSQGAISLPLPAGTPIALFANLDPNNPLHNNCPDLIENEGHYFGALMSPGDKQALTEYLKTK